MKLALQRITEHTCAFKVPITTCKRNIYVGTGGLIVDTPDSMSELSNIPIKIQTDIALVHQHFTLVSTTLSGAVLTLRCTDGTQPFVVVIFPVYTDVQ